MSVEWRCEVCGTKRMLPRCRAKSRRVCFGCRGALLKTHGQHGTRLYRIWNNMHSRCRCSSTRAFDLYGGAGIKVCAEWMSFEGFQQWAMSSGYSDSLSIDRIDSSGDYSPSNCRWATKQQQSANTRKPRLKTYSRFKGVTFNKRHGHRKRWIAQGTANGVRFYLGEFLTEEEAANAYDSWAKRSFGEFACLNQKQK